RAFLGDVGQVQFRVELRAGDELLHARVDVPLPVRFHVDALYLDADELEGLVGYEVRRAAPDGTPPTADVVVVGSPATGDGLSLDEYREVLGAFRSTVLGSRGVDGRDLAPAAEQPEPTVDTSELTARADAA